MTEEEARDTLSTRIGRAIGGAIGASIVVVAIFGAQALWGVEPTPMLVGIYIVSAAFDGFRVRGGTR